MTATGVEVNYDGLPGLTHHHAGLAFGNLASMAHRRNPSNPLNAAHAGLAKMRLLCGLGLTQAVLPPHERPDIGTLRKLGFSGSDGDILDKAWKTNPELLEACYSASPMWTANAATVSPSADTADGKLHITPANLANCFHRSIETAFTARVLKKVFDNQRHFVHHDPLPAHGDFGDEGAANHTRLCPDYGERGIELFVAGHDSKVGSMEIRFPTRQTAAASRAVARLHGLSPAHTLFALQQPLAINAGVFHNDVVCVGDRNLLLCHASAFVDQAGLTEQIRRQYGSVCHADLQIVEIGEAMLSLEQAVSSYLFNSQLVALADGRHALIAPAGCREMPAVQRCVDYLLSDQTSIDLVRYVELDESLKNGGGPACLRLRVVLTDEERAQAHSGVFFDDRLDTKLVAWVEKHYRTELRIEDLRDPALLTESRTALDELSKILDLGSIYPFQRDTG